MFNRFILAFFLFLSSVFFVFSESVTVSAYDSVIKIGGRFSYWEDASGFADIKDVASFSNDVFSYAGGMSDVSFGFKRSPMWFCIDFDYKGYVPSSFLLVLDYSLVDDVRLYTYSDNDTWVVYDNSSYKGSYRPVFTVTLRPGHNRLYLRMFTDGTLRLPLYLYTEKAYRAFSSKNIALEGLYIGAILLAAFINLFFFYVYKRESDGVASLFLSLFILFYAVFQAIQDGFVLFVFSKNIVPLFHSYVISGVLGLVSLGFFMIFFFRRDKSDSLLWWIFMPFWAAACVFVVLTFFTEPSFYVKAFAITGVLSFIPNLWLVLSAKGRRVFLGRELLYAYMLLILSIVIFGLRGLGFIPSNGFTLNIIPAGFLVFIVLLTLIQFKRLQVAIEEKYAMEKNWKELYDASSKFVPNEFLSFMEKGSIKDVHLGDQTEAELTLMFSDIRNFTSIAEKLTAAETFEFLNDYFNCIGPIIRKYHGFIDKYIGDGIMAIFPAKADDALAAALEMGREIAVLNRRYGLKGWPEIRTGIGIHSGLCMVGTVGEELRMDTTVISDVVNIASRLESLTKIFGTRVIISEQVVMSLSNPADMHLRFLGKVMVKGKSSAVSVFQVLSDMEFIKEQKFRAVYDYFEQGMFAFFKRDFDRAIELFKRVLESIPNDVPSRVYLRQAMSLRESGVPDGWDGYLKFSG